MREPNDEEINDFDWDIIVSEGYYDGYGAITAENLYQAIKERLLNKLKEQNDQES